MNTCTHQQVCDKLFNNRFDQANALGGCFFIPLGNETDLFPVVGFNTFFHKIMECNEITVDGGLAYSPVCLEVARDFWKAGKRKKEGDFGIAFYKNQHQYVFTVIIAKNATEFYLAMEFCRTAAQLKANDDTTWGWVLSLMKLTELFYRKRFIEHIKEKKEQGILLSFNYPNE